uniref:Methylthioribose-1-phosphate isomerase n=1 Tax=Anthurium amnicola TaxID=1678845 RepID=A0A1D1XJ75_9ARAE
MVLDREPEQHQPCTGGEHLSKSIGCNDTHLDSETLKDDNEVNSKGSCGYTLPEKVADPSTLGDKSGALAYTVVEDSTKGNQNNGGHKTAPCSFPLPHFEMVRKEMDFYMDKGVTEIELPKIIVCYKEGSYHIVKDVCIDERIHSMDKVLVEHESAYEKCCNISQFDTRHECTNEPHISNALNSSNLNEQPISEIEGDSKDDSLGSLLEECEGATDTLDGIVSFEANEKIINERMFPSQESDVHQFQGCTIDVHNENIKQRSLSSLLEEDSAKSDIAGENIHAFETEGLLTVQECDIGHCLVGLSSFESNLDPPYLIKNETGQPQSVNGDSEQPQNIKCESHQLQYVRGDCIKLLSTVGNTEQLHSVCDRSNRELADEITSVLEESNTTTSNVSSEEHKEGNEAKNLSGNGKSGSNIVAFDIDLELPATTPKDIQGVSEFQQSGLATSGTALEDTATDGSGSLARTLFNHPSQADTNFLGPAALSGRIVYTGQIPYSGSISLRSDSSTTSTRSFAFPILQSEWNNSPVRMARADRRHFRKHRFWRSGILCCRF